jgi:lipopolysaccharide cholinephosphotransferase
MEGIMNNLGYTQDELRKIQLIQMDILKEIHRICEEHNIEYFIIGGTALGAVRHKGFIPWDDDIDIGMTRSNYDRFNKIAEKHLREDLVLQNIETDRYSPFPYTKVRKRNTKFVEYCNRNLKMFNGIYVDIFPYDNIPDEMSKRKKQYYIVQLLLRIYIYRNIPDITVKPTNLYLKIKQCIRRIVHYILKPIPKKLLYKILVKNMIKYNNDKTKMKACLLFPKFMVECMSNEVLYPLKKVEFENNYFYAPNNCDEYLKTHYGNYWELPPENQRVGHKPYIVEL